MSQKRFESLDDIRAHIDTIDHRLFSLLLERSGSVAHVAALKRGQAAPIPLRPDREARQLIQLYDWYRASGTDFPFVSIVRIWREIISAAIAQQGGVCIYTQDHDRGDARDYFGSVGQYEAVSSAAQAIEKADQNHGVAVISLTDILTLSAATALQGSFFARLSWVGHAHLFAYVPLSAAALQGDLAEETGARDNFCGLSWLPQAAQEQVEQAETLRILGTHKQADLLLVEGALGDGDAVQSAKMQTIGCYANFQLHDSQSS